MERVPFRRHYVVIILYQGNDRRTFYNGDPAEICGNGYIIVSLQKGENHMFNFRLINTPDGNQIIDTTLKTPYSSLTPIEMMEYTEVDNRLAYMERMERKQQREAECKRKFT